ncbi:MAG: wax ester/triacylglycerol synthase family O-acyltransferase [Gammaproteobacteria bacterium]|nr:wax ester/triacylglycerol synthase family O-acyltransferase [Gammaproteobacteria bacterium]
MTTPKQLSGLDSLFLYLENSRIPMEVSSLHIYDPSTAPNGIVRFKEVLATFDNRIENAPIFRRKIRELPFSIDNPYWVDDENFDIEYHVRHIALPKPGDWRQLMIQISRLQSRPLDKARPLWEVYVIEGLNNVRRLKKGCFALFMKMHHATIDGVSGAALQAAIHDLEPIQADASDYTPGIRNYAETTPGLATLLAKSPLNNLRKSAQLALGIGKSIPRMVKAQLASSDGESTEVPSTVFNRGGVSANRVIDARVFDLNDVKAIAKTQPDAKVNDVVLAVIGGALRKYLESQDDLPAESLIAACPLDIRSNVSMDSDNLVSMMNAPLCTDISDPRKRLQAVVRGSRRAKGITEVLGAETLTIFTMNLPAFFAQGLTSPLMSLASRLDAMAFNTIVSNVAGFQKPLYFCGAKMIALYGIGPIVEQAGLNHTIFSYNGKITITFSACREMLPDPEFYADCIQTSFDELKKATLAPKTKARKKTARKKAKTAKKKTVRKKVASDKADTSPRP